VLRRFCALGVLLTVMGCGSNSSSPTNPTSTQTVLVSGTPIFTSANQTSQLTATATLSNGTTQNVSAQATWQSSNKAVATVSATGLVTSVGAGTAIISAVYQGQTGTVLASVTIPSQSISNCFYKPASPQLSMSATIDGVPWTAACISVTDIVTAAGQSTEFLLIGTDPQIQPPPSATLVLVRASSLAGTTSSGLPLFLQAQINVGSNSWVTPTKTAGTITFSTLTGASASGTFSFSATGGPVGKSVTNGAFNVAF
jgi:trimeric autotransporter adhesin